MTDLSRGRTGRLPVFSHLSLKTPCLFLRPGPLSIYTSNLFLQDFWLRSLFFFFVSKEQAFNRTRPLSHYPAGR